MIVDGFHFKALSSVLSERKPAKKRLSRFFFKKSRLFGKRATVFFWKKRIDRHHTKLSQYALANPSLN